MDKVLLIFLLLPLFSDHWIFSSSFLPKCPMTTRLTYSTSDLRQFFDNCRRFYYPGASNFLQSLTARSSPFFKVPNKHRRGWQVTQRSQSLHKLSIPSLISLNARPLLNKIAFAKPLFEQVVPQYRGDHCARVVAQQFN